MIPSQLLFVSVITLFPASASPWLLEEIKPLDEDSGVSKKSTIAEVSPTGSALDIKHDIQKSILGQASTHEPEQKLKEGVKKLLDFLDAGPLKKDDEKPHNSTQGDASGNGALNAANSSKSPALTSEAKSNGSDGIPMKDDSVSKNLLNGVASFSQNPSRIAAAQSNTFKAYSQATSLARSQVPHAGSSIQRNQWSGQPIPSYYNNFYQRSGIPVAQPRYRYGYYGYQGYQYPVQTQFQRQQIPTAYRPQLRRPNNAASRLTSPWQRSYQRAYTRPLAPRPYQVVRPSVPVTNRFLAGSPYAASRGGRWPGLHPPIVQNRAHAPYVQRSQLPLRMSSSLRSYLARRTLAGRSRQYHRMVPGYSPVHGR